MSIRQLKVTKSITNRESESVQRYLREISKEPRITPEEESALAVLIKKGDRDAAHRLVKANLRFVVSVAKQYQNMGLSLGDLINEGNIGLIKAATKFDDTRGFKFISFAVWWIRQCIMQSLADQSRMIRLPVHKVLLGRKLQKAQSTLEQQFEREPSVEELAELLNADEEDIAQVMKLSDRPASLDASFSDDENSSLLDMLEDMGSDKTDRDLYYAESMKLEIGRSFSVLSARQRDILCQFFGIGVEQAVSLEDLGAKFNLSTERMRQIKDKAILKLRAAGNTESLRGFL